MGSSGKGGTSQVNQNQKEPWMMSGENDLAPNLNMSSNTMFSSALRGEGIGNSLNGPAGQAPTTSAGRNAVGYGVQNMAQALAGAMLAGPVGAVPGIKGVRNAAKASAALQKGTITQAKMTPAQRASVLGELGGGSSGLGSASTGDVGDARDEGDHY